MKKLMVKLIYLFLRLFADINDVEIVGTLISDAFTMKSGGKALTVRTNDSPTK